MWREQMQLLAGSPKAMQEYAKLLGPSFSFLTQSLDMWLSLFEPLNTQSFNWADVMKADNFTAASQGKNNDAPKANTKTSSRKNPAKKTAGKDASGKDTSGKDGTAPTAAADGHSRAAVAELAERVAYLKEHQKRKDPAAKLAGAQSGTARPAEPRSKSRRKA
jgi:hypothetical protein